VDAKDDLQRICAEDIPSLVRVSELRRLWRSVVRDPERPETDRLKEMVLSLDDLPASTFHAVVALADLPEAAIWTLFTVGSAAFETVWEGLQRLSFAWWALPLAAWQAGISRFADQMEQRAAAVLGAERARSGTLEAVEATFSRIHQRWSGGEVVFDALATAGTTGLPAEQLSSSELLMARSPAGRDILTNLLCDAAMELRQRQAESRWPTWPDRSAPEISPIVRRIVQKCAPASMSFHLPVLSGPVFVAEQVITGVLLSSEQLLATRIFRAFDPQWFDLAQSISMAFFWNDRNTR